MQEDQRRVEQEERLAYGLMNNFFKKSVTKVNDNREKTGVEWRKT